MNRRTDALNAAYKVLNLRQAEPQALCAAIVEIGKPFDEGEIRRAAPLVVKFLKHDDFLVRYQAIWFLGCWGKLPDYLDKVIEAAKHDAEIDNRAFAARCAGIVLQKHMSSVAIAALLVMATDEGEEAEIRLSAYSGLLRTWSRPEAVDFEPIGNKSLPDMDPTWLEKVRKWTAKHTHPTQTQPSSLNS